MNKAKWVWATLLLAMATSAGLSQEGVERYVRLILNDGAVKEGRFVGMDEERVSLEMTDLGLTHFPKYLIEVMIDIDPQTADRVSGDRAFEANPQASRYFFAPSGIQLRKGEGYFQSNVLLNSVSYGFSDGFTAGALVSVLGGGATAKVGKSLSEKVSVSAGGIAFADFYGIFDGPVGLAFGNVTIGNERANLTVNAGFGNQSSNGTYYGGVIETFNSSTGRLEYLPTTVTEASVRPLILNVSAMTPISTNRWVVTENYFVRTAYLESDPQPYVGPAFDFLPRTVPRTGADDIGIVSLGVRSLNRRTGWLWDYGLVGVFTASGDGVALPWFSFTLAF